VGQDRTAVVGAFGVPSVACDREKAGTEGPVLVHFRPGAMSDMSPSCALKQNLANRYERNSLLTLRTPERRASVLHEALHDPRAAIGFAFLALAVVDLERMLEIAEFAGCLADIAQRRAAGLDRLKRRTSTSGNIR
jgi:hypothetical protein